MFRTVLLLVVLTVSVLAFTAPVATRPARMTMMFGGGAKKAAPAATSGSSANKGEYIPDGLTKEQYQKVLDEAAKKSAAKKKIFFKGKDTMSLTEWMNQEEKKGLSGKDLNIKGHRMVKAKYDSFYTDEQSGVSW